MTKLVMTILTGLVLSLAGVSWYLAAKVRRAQAALDLEKLASIRVAHLLERLKLKGLSDEELAKRANANLDSVRRSVEHLLGTGVGASGSSSGTGNGNG